MIMNKEYLEWLFLREKLSDWFKANLATVCIKGDTYSFHGKLYDIQKIEDRYIDLTKELLKEYEI